MNVSLVTKKIKTAYGVSTNSELAQKLGITVSAIEAWSRRKSIPEGYIFKCVNEMGVSMEWLLDKDKTNLNIESNSNNSKNDVFSDDILKSLDIIKSMTNNNQDLSTRLNETLKTFIKDNL